jgi:hypothetical protein
MTADGVRSLIENVRSAINRHDLDAFLVYFDEDYVSFGVRRRLEERGYRFI